MPLRSLSNGREAFVGSSWRARAFWLLKPAKIPNAGGADRVVRAGDVEVKCDFAGRVVGNGPWVVVMRPVLAVVFVLADFVNFTFGFHVAVFGDTDVDADATAVNVLHVQSGVVDGFVAAVDSDAAGAGAASGVFARLMSFDVKVTNAGDGFSEVANLIVADSAAAVKHRVAHFG